MLWCGVIRDVVHWYLCVCVSLFSVLFLFLFLFLFHRLHVNCLLELTHYYLQRRYMDKMQKQRFEFEDLLARRLREQEGNLTRAANEALYAKDKSMESVVNAAASAQQAEYEAALKGNTDILKTELSATYEAEFGAKLAEEKASMIKEMESAVSTIDNLSKRLQQAEENLQISRNFESGSQRAHRVSAAALALAEKMESSMGAGEEVAALKAASAESSVIASALEKIPSSVKAGIPTLPELQSSFDQVYDIGREVCCIFAYTC